MKSGNKIKDVYNKLRKKIIQFMYVEDYVDELEKEEKIPFKDRLKKNWFKSIVVPLFIIVVITATLINHNINEAKRLEALQGEYYVKEVDEKDKAQIESKEYSNLFYNKSTKKAVKMAYTTLNGQVSYSLTYGNDDKVTGELITSKYFSKGETVSLLLHGYPNVSFKDLGLENEEEAYIATQLAMYQLAQFKEYSMRGEDAFSLEDLVPADNKDKEKCERIINKANEIYNASIESPYVIGADEETTGYDTQLQKTEDSIVAGPFVSTIKADQETIDYLKDKYNPTVDISATSLLNDTSVHILDKDGNEINKVQSGEEYYVKVDTSSEAFAFFKIYAHDNYLKARIYATDSSKKQYVTLSYENIHFIETGSIISGLDTGVAWIWFDSEYEEVVSDVSFRLYTEDGKLIEDVEGYTDYYEFKLPVGKYYMEIYSLPKNHFLDAKEYEFEVVKDKEHNFVITVESTVGLGK